MPAHVDRAAALAWWLDHGWEWGQEGLAFALSRPGLLEEGAVLHMD